MSLKNHPSFVPPFFWGETKAGSSEPEFFAVIKYYSNILLSFMQDSANKSVLNVTQCQSLFPFVNSRLCRQRFGSRNYGSGNLFSRSPIIFDFHPDQAQAPLLFIGIHLQCNIV
jgi:hypothetical protein